MSNASEKQQPSLQAEASAHALIQSAEQAIEAGNYRLAREILIQLEALFAQEPNGPAQLQFLALKRRLSPDPLHLIFLIAAALFLLTLTIAAYLQLL